MKSPDDDTLDDERRSFLASTGGLLSSAWFASQWPAIAAAHDHAQQAAAASAPPAAWEYLSAADAADVEAIAAQIVPSGTTPGAREAQAVHFVDRALSTFFAAWSDEFRRGLATFQSAFRGAEPPAASFAAASSDRQIAFLRTVDKTAFFENMRFLTLLGMFSSPKYGGNYDVIGWKLIGFRDQHVFSPPFGYYDREYTGFVPYTEQS
jgi:hypothetical protein